MSHIFQKSDHHVALLCREAGRSMKSPSLFPSDGFDRSFIRCIRNCNRERPSVVGGVGREECGGLLRGDPTV